MTPCSLVDGYPYLPHHVITNTLGLKFLVFSLRQRGKLLLISTSLIPTQSNDHSERPNFPCRLHKIQPLGIICNQVHAANRYVFYKIFFNIILATPGPPKLHLAFGNSDVTFLCISHEEYSYILIAEWAR